MQLLFQVDQESTTRWVLDQHIQLLFQVDQESTTYTTRSNPNPPEGPCTLHAPPRPGTV